MKLTLLCFFLAGRKTLMSGNPPLSAPKVIIRRHAKSATNVTSALFILNTNIPVQNKTEEQVVSIRDYISEYLEQHLLGSSAAMGKVFGNAPLVQSIEVDSFNWEVGYLKHRIHANLVLTIRHQVAKYSVIKASHRLQAWLNSQKIDPVVGWYVHNKLSDMKSINYANKEIRKVANEQIAERDELADEIERLSVEDDE